MNHGFNTLVSLVQNDAQQIQNCKEFYQDLKIRFIGYNFDGKVNQIVVGVNFNYLANINCTSHQFHS